MSQADPRDGRFFMNWFATLPAGTEGWEFHLLAVALAAVVVLRGSGALSLDRAIARRVGATGADASAAAE